MQKRKSNSLRENARFFKAASVAALMPAVFAASHAMATAYTWVGGTSSTWEDATNWASAGGTFPSAASDTANFLSSAQTTVTVTAADTIGEILFPAGGTGSFNIGNTAGGSLSFSGNTTVISNTSANSQTVSAPISMTAAATIAGSGTGFNSSLNITGTVTTSLNITTRGTLSATNQPVNTISTITGTGALTGNTGQWLLASSNPGTGSSGGSWEMASQGSGGNQWDIAPGGVGLPSGKGINMSSGGGTIGTNGTFTVTDGNGGGQISAGNGWMGFTSVDATPSHTVAPLIVTLTHTQNNVLAWIGGSHGGFGIIHDTANTTEGLMFNASTATNAGNISTATSSVSFSVYNSNAGVLNNIIDLAGVGNGLSVSGYANGTAGANIVVGNIPGSPSPSINFAKVTSVIEDTSVAALGHLNKWGPGTLILSANNTYAGNTFINNGTLLLTGTNASPITVAQVAATGGVVPTLGGTGSTSGAVSVGDGVSAAGVLSPGNPNENANGIGTLGTGPLTINSNGALSIELNSAGAGVTGTYDAVNVNGLATLGGTLNLVDLAPATTITGTLTILTSTSPITGNFATLAEGSSITVGANNYVISYMNDDVTLKEVPIGPPTGTWTNANLSSTWGDNADWSPATAINASGGVANFTGSDYGTIGAGTVALNSNKTVGILNINGTSGNAVNYTFTAGGGTLVIDDASDPVTPNPSINVAGGGSHAINTPISLLNGVTVNLSNVSTLAINNTISGSGPMTVTGSGTVSIGTAGKLNSTSSLSVLGGAHVALAASASPLAPNVQTVASLTVDGTSLLDLANNQMMVTTATESSIMSQLAAGYGNGTWNGTHGITSSTAATDPGHGIGYATSGSGVLMEYTIAGDATMDGTVNFNDLLALAGSYTSTTADWSAGDFNYDGTVNFSDLLLLAGTYTQTLTANPSEGISASFAADWALAQAEVAAVPEPTSLALLGVGAAGLLARRRRRAAK